MRTRFWQNVHGLVLICVWISWCTCEEEIICRNWKYITCLNSKTIRVHDVIYGHVVGRNECNTHPTTNCTAPNGFCEVAEKLEGRTSQWIDLTLINPTPCPGAEIYIIIKYSCLKEPKLEGENFAFNKPSMQSQTTHDGFASRAVDGSKSRYYNGRSCTHTAEETTPWWRVDLQQRISITHVQITNRDQMGKRLCGFEIRIGDNLKNNGIRNTRCGTRQHIPTNMDGIVSCEPSLVGRYVTIVLPGEMKILTLCEVEVYGNSVLGNQSLTELHLVGSVFVNEGYLLNAGRTFCDPMWSIQDANVACIQLGYSGANIAYWNNSLFGDNENLPGENPIEKKYNCSGKEGSLNECRLQIVDSEKTCEKQKAVSVTCQSYLRLSGSNIPLEGRIEVLHLGIWGTVCGYSDKFFAVSARVVCRELGFYDVVEHGKWTKGPQATGRVWLRNVQCRGDEKSLVFCPHSNWKGSCYHKRDRYVKCSICSNGLLQDIASFPDSVFNASAAAYPDFRPSSARLYNAHPWCLPENNTDENQFLEISLPGIFSLSAVATVGGINLGYVTSYMLSYRVNGYSWKYATVGTKKILYGNTNDDTHNVVRRDLDTAIHAEIVRFIPKTWQRMPCMRVELCGKEIPRCNPANVTAESITTNSLWISWLPKTNTLHNNYSVSITTEDGKIQYFNTTEQTSLFVANLLPYRKYFYTVKAIDLADCFEENLNLMFRTKEAAPSGPPTKIRLVSYPDSTSVQINWSPPEANQQNGIISSYQLCYSDKHLQSNCSALGKVSHIRIDKTSATIKQLEPGVVYYFRIRANTTGGAGPYSEEVRIITSSGDLKKSEDVNTTAYSFAVQLQQPERDFRYVQIIVIKLEVNNDNFGDPRSYTPDKILMVNETAPILQPYVTAELAADQVHELNTFVIGDGINYGRPAKRKRREVESFTKRYDENEEQEWGDRRTGGSLKPRLFYNRPLEPDSIYSAFQRTYINEDTHYSSSWSEPVRTNMKDTEDAGRMSTSSSGSGALIGIGVGVAVVFIILIILLILFCLKRGKKKKLGKTNSRVQIVMSNASVGNLQDEGEYETFNDGNQYMAMDDLGADDRDTDSETDAAGDNPVNPDNTETLYGNAKVTETRDPFRMVPSVEFENYVQDLKKNDNFGFDCQFKELPQGISYPCTIAKSPENKPKNRYGNIVSYDDALVTLTDNGHRSYINASFITGVEPKSYIATQGPTAKTISTFWEMIWEQECSVIVMLTNLKEGEKVKCAKYWTDSSKAFGKIILTFQEKELFPYYVIRKFLLEKGESKRFVTQFHFTAWPDHGVPKYPTQLLAFQHAIRSTGVETGPIVVHCSAGVGRTGTFIVIDNCLENFSHQEQRSVDVFHIVQEMRKCRVNMIQTLEQYILVHEAILEFILCGFNELEGNALAHAIQKLKKTNPSTKQTGFAEIFERLRNFSPVLTKQECKTATLERNSCKNRTKEICPADFARVTLSSSVSTSDYINATFVDGFQQKNVYIATECPLVNTFDNFWQMIYEQRSPLVIMLNNWKEGREKYPEYFPTEEGYITKYGNLYVRLDEQVSDKAIVFRKFAISLSSTFESRNVLRHFQYTHWPKRTVPDKPDDILQLIHTIQTAQRKNTQGPMVVHCGNGAGRTGTFITISICMERLKIEQRVDVFQCIKLIREQRPQFVENELQLQFCYEVLAKFTESFEGYSNFIATD